MAPYFINLQEAVDFIAPEKQIGISGNMVMSPMALIREIIRQGKRNLSLLFASSAAINADLLIGAKIAAQVEFPSISLGEYGAAPHFRRAVEQGDVAFKDHA